jgi:hypothetical protein
LANLITGAFFFACRSCEYLKVPVRGKTKLLRLRNITFTDDKFQQIPHDHPDIESLASQVTIQFKDQKNNHKLERRTQKRNNDAFLCPVKAWIRTITRIRTYNSTKTTPVNCYLPLHRSTNNNQIFFSQATVNKLLRYTVLIQPKTFLATKHPPSAPTPYARVPQWRSTSPTPIPTRSCYLGDGRQKHSFCIYDRKFFHPSPD